MDSIKFMSGFLSGLVAASAVLITSLLMVAFPSWSLAWLVAVLVVLVLSMRLALQKRTRVLSLLAVVAVAVLAGTGGWYKWGGPGVLLVLPGAGLSYWMLEEVWQFLVRVPEETLIVVRNQYGARLVSHPAPLNLKPLAETIQARVPLYPMQSIVAVERSPTGEGEHLTAVLHVRYALRNAEEWDRVLSMPGCTNLLHQIARRRRGASLQNTISWEYLFDHLIQYEVDRLVRRWIAAHESIGEVLDLFQYESTAPDRGGAFPSASRIQQDMVVRQIRTELDAALAPWGVATTFLEFLAFRPEGAAEP